MLHSDLALKLILYNYDYQKLIILHILIIYQKLYIFLGLIIVMGMLFLPYEVGAKIEIPNSLVLRHKLDVMLPLLVLEGIT